MDKILSTSLNDFSPLKRYGHDLTLLAQKGFFSPLAGYETEISKVFQVLLRRTHRYDFYNPVIIDTDGTTRWLLVAEVVRRIAIGEAPDTLSSQQVIALDYQALFTNLPNDYFKRRWNTEQSFPEKPPLTELQVKEWIDTLLQKPFWPPLEDWVTSDVLLQRLQAIFIALSQAEGRILLFVDPLDRLLGGEWDQYPISAAELLKPVLARRQIQLMGACTLGQYQRYIEHSAAVQRRFQGILMPDAWRISMNPQRDR